MGALHCNKSQKVVGTCMGCGCPLKQSYETDEYMEYYGVEPNEGKRNYRNYMHKHCARSHLVNYDLLRYNATVCLYDKAKLQWGIRKIKQNGEIAEEDTWLYCEQIDLLIALRLSDQMLLEHLENNSKARVWNTVLRYAPILQLTGKSIPQCIRKLEGLQKKWFSKKPVDRRL